MPRVAIKHHAARAHHLAEPATTAGTSSALVDPDRPALRCLGPCDESGCSLPPEANPPSLGQACQGGPVRSLSIAIPRATFMPRLGCCRADDSSRPFPVALSLDDILAARRVGRRGHRCEHASRRLCSRTTCRGLDGPRPARPGPSASWQRGHRVLPARDAAVPGVSPVNPVSRRRRVADSHPHALSET
jgi:hypothetical protein